MSKSTKETEEQQRLRFQIELEFVQCLANPNYLNCGLLSSCLCVPFSKLKTNRFLLPVLAQRNFLNDKTFVNYLKYLRYWKRPEYTKYLK